MRSNILKITALGASILMMAGCAKTISYAEAVEHVRNNFTSTESKKCKEHTVTDVTKSEGIFATIIKTEKTEEDNETTEFVLSAGALVDSPTYVYKLDGNALISECSISGDDIVSFLETQMGGEMEIPEVPGMEMKIDGSINATVTTTQEGYPSKMSLKMDISIKMSSSGSLPGLEGISMPEMTLDGAVAMSMEVTYIY